MSIYGKCGKYYRATVNYTFADGLASDRAYILSNDINIPAMSFSLEEKSAELDKGKTIRLKTTIIPAIATDKEVKWESSKPSIISVDDEGLVTAKKSGHAVITATMKNGELKDSCSVSSNAGNPSPVSAPKQASKKPELTGRSASLTSVKLKIKNGPKTVSGCKLRINGKTKLLKGVKIKLGKKKLKKNSFTLKKNNTYIITVTGLKKNKNYIFRIGKKRYSSNSLKLRTGIPELTVSRNNAGLLLKWTKVSGGKGYQIFRGTTAAAARTAKKPYKTISSISKLNFTDAKVRAGGKYYYCIKSKKGKYRSKVKSGTLPGNVENNMVQAKKLALFNNVAINSDTNWDANEFSPMDGVHPYVKYRFTGKELEIHVYVNFVQYNSRTRNVPVLDPTTKNDNSWLCTDAFLNGLKAGYNNVYISSGNGNSFGKNVSFNTKLIVHRARRETYNENQQFVEVRIGGFCPKDLRSTAASNYIIFTGGDNWFHAWRAVDNSGEFFVYIHMPTNSQLENNQDLGMQFPKTKTSYGWTASHEMGHALGLHDAYYDYDHNQDRCIENSETCYKYRVGDDNVYKNLMISNNIYIQANDLEMMLMSYNNPYSSKPYFVQEYYKSQRQYLEDGSFYNVETSEAIKNRKDEVNE